MTKTILEITKDLLELEKKAAPADYWVECVHDNYGGIGYEVSAKGQSLHVIFHENNCMDQKITAKVQANLYALCRNHIKEICEALIEARLAMKRTIANSDADCYSIDAKAWLKKWGTE